MTDINGKENKKIDMNKVLSMILVIVLSIILLAIVGSLLFVHHIEAEIISCEQNENFQQTVEIFLADDYYTCFNMSDAEAEDLRENPENYRNYYIYVELNNFSKQIVYDVQVDLIKQYNNIWSHHEILGDTSNIIIDPGFNTYTLVSIIVKTSDMTEKEIDELIRSLGITVSARNVEWLPLITSETIYFEK